MSSVAPTDSALNLYEPHALIGRTLTEDQAHRRLTILIDQQNIFGDELTPRSKRELKELVHAFSPEEQAKQPLSVRITRTAPSRFSLFLSKVYFPSLPIEPCEDYRIVFAMDPYMRTMEGLQKSARVLDLFTPSRSDWANRSSLYYLHKKAILESIPMQWYRNVVLNQVTFTTDCLGGLKNAYIAYSQLVESQTAPQELSYIQERAAFLFEGQMIFNGCCCEVELVQCILDTKQSLARMRRLILGVDEQEKTPEEFATSVVQQYGRIEKEAQSLFQAAPADFQRLANEIVEQEAWHTTAHSEKIQDSAQQFLAALGAFKQEIQQKTTKRTMEWVVNAVQTIGSATQYQTSRIQAILHHRQPPIRSRQEALNFLNHLCQKIADMHAMWLQCHKQFEKINNVQRGIERHEKAEQLFKEGATHTGYVPSDLTRLSEAAFKISQHQRTPYDNSEIYKMFHDRCGLDYQDSYKQRSKGSSSCVML